MKTSQAPEPQFFYVDNGINHLNITHQDILSELDLETILLINTELERAKKLHPEFPSDIAYQALTLAEEAGECGRAALNAIFEGGDIEEFYTEATHTAAVAIRILENRDK